MYFMLIYAKLAKFILTCFIHLTKKRFIVIVGSYQFIFNKNLPIENKNNHHMMQSYDHVLFCFLEFSIKQWFL